jgi:hypothetical protein
VTPENLDSLVEHMFDQVLGEPERAELLLWIREWEAANPDVDAAHRVTGWIDIAYAFQARRAGRGEVRRPAHVAAVDSSPALLSVSLV